MNKTIQFKGNPLHLGGRSIALGQAASDIRITSQQLQEVRLKDFTGKVKIVTSFPSLDTPVCDLQVKEFNKQASGFGSDIVVIGISMDLPFAQQRFCESFEIKNVVVLSDYKYSSFGINYGMLIRELGLLARSILIIDKNNTLRYVQVVNELSAPPDYQDALNAVQGVVRNPAVSRSEEMPGHCKPCEGAVASLPKERIETLLAQRRGWELKDGKKIFKEFRFKGFADSKFFVGVVSVIAEEQGHHPAILLTYNKVKVTLTTHAASGLTDNDFIMARIIDEAA